MFPVRKALEKTSRLDTDPDPFFLSPWFIVKKTVIRVYKSN